MKALVHTKFGSPEKVLQLQEVAQPVPGNNEILIKVKAASVTFTELGFVTGEPFTFRLMGAGLFKPKIHIPGGDVAGQVEAIGENVTQFKPGDEVFGDISVCGFGAFAEYVSAPENILVKKPTQLSFEEAAAVPQTALVALQALRDYGKIQQGQKVVINGASGGIGTFAVQIAKAFGAEVTAVCSTRNLEIMRKIGADHVINYTQEDFTQNGLHYDLIFATAGYHSIFDYKKALSPTGTCVISGGTGSQFFQAMLLGPMISKKGGMKLGTMYLRPNQKDLEFVGELLEAGKIVPVIDKRYPLAGAAEALRYYGGGHAQGKVVLTINQDN